jgi:glycosyltransferase involved in cell wall biosynthesis
VRILYLTDRLDMRGGAWPHLLQIVRWALGSGHDVTVAHGARGPGVELPVEVASLRVRGLATAVDSASRLGALAGSLRRCDLVHLQNVMNPEVVRRAASTGRAVVTVQDHRVLCPGPGKTLPDGSACRVVMDREACSRCLPEMGYLRRTLDLTRRRLKALDGARLLVLSTYMADELAAVGRDDARVLPPWVEVGRRRSHPGSAWLLGGRMVAHKGVLDAWRAWRRTTPRMPLRVAGSGPLEDDLEGARRLGWLSPTDLRDELRAARALLFPCRWQEPFGILGVESLAEATPVVVADTGGTREWSDSGCLRVPPGDPVVMAEAMAELAEDDELALRLGAEGRDMVAERFSRSRIERSLAEVYTEVLDGAPGN